MGRNLLLKKNDAIGAKIVGDSLIVHQGTEKKIIGMSEIDKIKESKFDLGGTITISIVALTI